MFKVKDTINTSQLKSEPYHLSNLEGDDVVQVVQKDSPIIKVLITQQYFLSILTDAMRARFILDGEQQVTSDAVTISKDQRIARAKERAKKGMLAHEKDS